MKRFCLTLIALTAGIGAVAAQSPYTGMQDRPIKALSAEQTADLKAGRGMGLALAAELNGYPGPAHVLELADHLALTDQQRDSVKQLFEAMKAEAVPLGEKLIVQETDLNRQFAGRTVTPESLKAATAAIGQTQATLRDTHLKYHLATVKLLTSWQQDRYAQLRGYAETGHTHHHPGSN